MASKRKGYSVHKSGYYWCARFRDDSYRLQSWNTGVRTFKPKEQAEKVAAKHFGTFRKAKNTTQKISDYNKARQIRRKQQLESHRISENIPKFLDTKDNPRTIKEYKTHLDFLVSSTNDLHISKLALKHLYKAQSELKEGTRTHNTICKYFRTIRAFVNFMIKYDEKDEYLNLIKVQQHLSDFVKTIEKENHYFDRKDYDQIRTYLAPHPQGDIMLTYVEFALHTGARLSECLKGSINPKEEGFEWEFVGKMGVKHRRFLDQDLCNKWLLLQDYLQKDEDGIIDELSRINLSNLMSKNFGYAAKRLRLFKTPQFLATQGLQQKDIAKLSRTKVEKLGNKCLLWIYATQLGRSIKSLTEQEKAEALTENWSFHSLRYTWNQEKNKQVGLEKTSKIIGHSSLKTTEGYVVNDQFALDKKHNQRIFS